MYPLLCCSWSLAVFWELCGIPVASRGLTEMEILPPHAGYLYIHTFLRTYGDDLASSSFSFDIRRLASVSITLVAIKTNDHYCLKNWIPLKIKFKKKNVDLYLNICPTCFFFLFIVFLDVVIIIIIIIFCVGNASDYWIWKHLWWYILGRFIWERVRTNDGFFFFPQASCGLTGSITQDVGKRARELKIYSSQQQMRSFWESGHRHSVHGPRGGENLPPPSKYF